MLRLLPSLSLFLLLTGCSADVPTTPNEQPVLNLPSECKDYDAARKGLQIECIYFDQSKNGQLAGVGDEWITLFTTSPVRTAGWVLNAGDDGQNFSLPDTVFERLTIYTTQAPDTAKGQVISLKHGNWLWNNTDPDTARLLDASRELVDIHTYQR
jgi:hypothetical protein